MNSISLDQVLGDRADGDHPGLPEPIAHRHDTRGLSCPMPIVKTAQAMAGLASGELLESSRTAPSP
jgi:Sulfurtransferase TusA